MVTLLCLVISVTWKEQTHISLRETYSKASEIQFVYLHSSCMFWTMKLPVCVQNANKFLLPPPPPFTPFHFQAQFRAGFNMHLWWPDHKWTAASSHVALECVTTCVSSDRCDQISLPGSICEWTRTSLVFSKTKTCCFVQLYHTDGCAVNEMTTHKSMCVNNWESVKDKKGSAHSVQIYFKFMSFQSEAFLKARAGFRCIQHEADKQHLIYHNRGHRCQSAWPVRLQTSREM